MSRVQPARAYDALYGAFVTRATPTRATRGRLTAHRALAHLSLPNVAFASSARRPPGNGRSRTDSGARRPPRRRAGLSSSPPTKVADGKAFGRRVGSGDRSRRGPWSV